MFVGPDTETVKYFQNYYSNIHTKQLDEPPRHTIADRILGDYCVHILSKTDTDTILKTFIRLENYQKVTKKFCTIQKTSMHEQKLMKMKKYSPPNSNPISGLRVIYVTRKHRYGLMRITKPGTLKVGDRDYNKSNSTEQTPPAIVMVVIPTAPSLTALRSLSLTTAMVVLSPGVVAVPRVVTSPLVVPVLSMQLELALACPLAHVSTKSRSACAWLRSHPSLHL